MSSAANDSKVTNQRIGSQHRITVTLPWLRIFVGFTAALLIFVLGLGSAKWLGIQSLSFVDTSTLLATLGGIMGAIFTAGGLVIALVSVYSLFSIESRIEGAVNRVKLDLHARVDSQIEYHVGFTQALDSGNWRLAEEYAQKLLGEFPSLADISSRLAESMAETYIEWFYQVRVMSKHAPQQFNWEAGASQTPAIFSLRESDMPELEAYEWLKKAIQRKDGSRAKLLAYLTLMYATQGRFDDMLASIKRNPEVTNYFKTSESIAVLTWACRENDVESKLGRLSVMLGISLPIPRDQVTSTLNDSEPMRPEQGMSASWLAMKRSRYVGYTTIAPLAYVQIQLINMEDGVRRGAAQVFALNDGGRNSRIPDSEVGDNPYIAIDDLVIALTQQFLFISALGADSPILSQPHSTMQD